MDRRFWKSWKRRKSSPHSTRPTGESATSPKPPVLNPATTASTAHPPPAIEADRPAKTQLWIRAYDAIGEDDPKPEPACDIGEGGDYDSEDARHHMDRLVQEGLRRTEKAADQRAWRFSTVKHRAP